PVSFTSKKGKTRSRRMALKVYHAEQSMSSDSYIQTNPRSIYYEFQTMQRIKALNRKHQLGLHVLPTFRFVAGGKNELPRILRTLLPPHPKITAKGRAEFLADATRQMTILSKFSISVHGDAFYPFLDPKTGKIQAIIADLGIYSYTPKKRTKKE
ncbi:MAG: hypothetical protein AABY11_01435, partial [archaeon]